MAATLSEDELRRIHRAVVEYASDCLFYTNAEGVVVWSNRANAEHLGYASPDEILGMRAIDFYVNPRARGHMMKELLTAGRSQDFVALIKRRGGEPFYAEMTCDAIRDETGKVVGVVGVARDITDHRHVADDLHRLQEFNETVLNTIPTALWTVDLDGTITWTNGALCRLVGCPTSDIVDRNVLRDAPPWTAPIRDCLAVVLDRGVPSSSKGDQQRLPDGRIIHLDVTVLPLREEGELAGALVEAIDVTERVQLQEELERLRKQTLH